MSSAVTIKCWLLFWQKLKKVKKTRLIYKKYLLKSKTLNKRLIGKITVKYHQKNLKNKKLTLHYIILNYIFNRKYTKKISVSRISTISNIKLFKSEEYPFARPAFLESNFLNLNKTQNIKKKYKKIIRLVPASRLQKKIKYNDWALNVDSKQFFKKIQHKLIWKNRIKKQKFHVNKSILNLKLICDSRETLTKLKQIQNMGLKKKIFFLTTKKYKLRFIRNSINSKKKTNTMYKKRKNVLVNWRNNLKFKLNNLKLISITKKIKNIPLLSKINDSIRIKKQVYTKKALLYINNLDKFKMRKHINGKYSAYVSLRKKHAHLWHYSALSVKFFELFGSKLNKLNKRKIKTFFNNKNFYNDSKLSVKRILLQKLWKFTLNKSFFLARKPNLLLKKKHVEYKLYSQTQVKRKRFKKSYKVLLNNKKMLKIIKRDSTKKSFNYNFLVNFKQIQILLTKNLIHNPKIDDINTAINKDVKASYLKVKKIMVLIRKSKNVVKKLKRVTPKKHFLKIKKIKRLKCYYKPYFKLQYLSIKHLNILIKHKSKSIRIYDYLFLNKHTSQNALLEFYLSKKWKDKKLRTKRKKVFFFNGWRKRLTTFKNARTVHWNAYTQKTLKKRRYKKFLYFYLKKKFQKNETVLDYFTNKFKLSYTFWINFMEIYNHFYNNKLKKKKVYQLPINLLFWKFLNKVQKQKRKIEIKINTWVRKKIKIKQTFWMQKKKKIPSFFTKQIYWNNMVSNNIHYDFLTNYFCILKQSDLKGTFNSFIQTNKLIKLHDFRYKS